MKSKKIYTYLFLGMMGFILSSTVSKFFKKNNSTLFFSLLGHKSGQFMLRKNIENKIILGVYGEDYSLLKYVSLPFTPISFLQNSTDKSTLYFIDKDKYELKKLNLNLEEFSNIANIKSTKPTGAIAFSKTLNQIIVGATLIPNKENILLFLNQEGKLQKTINLKSCLPMQISFSNNHSDLLLISDNKKIFCKYNIKSNSIELSQNLTHEQNFNFNFLESKDSEIYFYGSEIKSNERMPLLIRLNFLNHQNLANFWDVKIKDSIHSIYFDYKFDKIWMSFNNENKLVIFDPLKLKIAKVHTLIRPSYFFPIQKTDKLYVLSEGSENSRFFSLATMETNRRANYFIRLEELLMPPILFEGF